MPTRPTGRAGGDDADPRLPYLDHHATDKEKKQFPQLRAQVPHEQLVKLRGQVQTAKKGAPTRPHTAAPNSERPAPHQSAFGSKYPRFGVASSGFSRTVVKRA